MSERESSTIQIYLDDDPEPIASYHPPANFELDTHSLEDGPHVLKIVASDPSGHQGIRRIPFEVRNGPGIDVSGLNENDVVDGKVSVLINAYGGSYEEKWEPRRAETPAPIPTWAWVVFIFIVAWSMFYAAQQWRPTPEFAATPTYGVIGSEPETAAMEKTAKSSGPAMGAELYRTSCANCHQNNGQGIPNIFPSLAGDPVVVSTDPTRHIEIVLFGTQGSVINGVAYQTQMPAWAEQLSDREIAAVINHERSSWGNNAPAVTVEDVASVRRKKGGN